MKCTQCFFEIVHKYTRILDNILPTEKRQTIFDIGKIMFYLKAKIISYLIIIFRSQIVTFKFVFKFLCVLLKKGYI